MMKSKMMAGGGAMKSKMMTSGGKMGYADGGMPMVERDGKKIPAFAADGKGKMAGGGMSKMMASGGMSKMMASGGMHKMPDGKMMKDSDMKKSTSKMPPALAKHAAMKASTAHAGLKSGGMTKMAKGGGIESKGKTKGMMVKMMGSGGKKY